MGFRMTDTSLIDWFVDKLINWLTDCLGHMGAQHFVRHEEEEAFADWINKRLSKDKDVTHFLPLAVSWSTNIYSSYL